MQAVWVVFRKEVRSFLSSLIAYLVWGVFLVGVGLFFWVFGGNILTSGLADMGALFDYGPWFFLLLVPAITMRSLAEEYRTGTIELLLTRPISTWQLVLGKYLAALWLLLCCLLPTLLYFATIFFLGNPAGNLDSGAIWGAYLGLFCIGACFAATGLWASSLSENQLVAFVLAAFICFVLYQGFELVAQLPAVGQSLGLLLNLGLEQHYQSISRGVLDSRDLLYFVSCIAFFITLSHWRLRQRQA